MNKKPNNLVPGQRFPFSAGFWNPVIETARQAKDRANPTPGGSAGSLAASRAIVVYVKNTTGSAVGRNCPLKISGVVVSPTANEDSFRDHPIFNGIAPTDDSTAKIVITTEPIDDDEIGLAIVSGAAIVTVDVTDTAHVYAKPVASNLTKLISDPDGGFQILYVPTATGESLAAVLLSGCSCGDSGGGTGGGDSCCCPDGAYRMDLSSDIDTLYPNDFNTKETVAVTEAEHVHYVLGSPLPVYLKAVSEISTKILEDGTVFKIRTRVTVTRPDSGGTQNFGFGFVHALSAALDVLDYPPEMSAFSSGGEVGHSAGGGSAYEYTDAGFTKTGNDSIEFEYVIRINDASLMGVSGRFGFIGATYSSAEKLDVNWHFYPCIDGSPDTDGDGEGDGPGSGGVGV